MKPEERPFSWKTHLRRLRLEQGVGVFLVLVTVLFVVNVTRLLYERHQALLAYREKEAQLAYEQQRAHALERLLQAGDTDYEVVRWSILLFRKGPPNTLVLEVRGGETANPETASETEPAPPRWRDWWQAFHLPPWPSNRPPK